MISRVVVQLSSPWQFKCCGYSYSVDGYKDWGQNVYFNCSKDNRSPSRCGVPYSCCKPTEVSSQFINTLSSSLGSRCVPWLGKGLSMSSPNDPVLCCPLSYRVAPVFVQVVSPPLGWSPLSSFLVISLQVVTREVHRSSLRRLICPAQDHFIFLTV